MDQIHQRLKIGRGPSAFQIGLAEPQIALADQAGEDVVILDPDLGHRAGASALNPEPPPVAQDEVELPVLKRPGNPEHLGEVAWQVLLPLGRCQHGHPSRKGRLTRLRPIRQEFRFFGRHRPPAPAPGL